VSPLLSPVDPEDSVALAAGVVLASHRVVDGNGEQHSAMGAGHLGLAGNRARKTEFIEPWVEHVRGQSFWVSAKHLRWGGHPLYTALPNATAFARGIADM